MANLQIVPSCNKSVEAQYVEMKVPLYSYGCERKVKRALSHLKGIYSVNVNYAQQKVTVWGICNKDGVLETIKNKRKEARFWNPEDNVNLETETQSSPRHHHHRHHPTFSAFTKAKSFSFRAFKKVFSRSYSF
ncbi:hypothetical protein Nepgr_010918 [Nepenthes gracilis]|uniref:HMA domain-containing protein n=1 Tax=Nepenthes gracilis TaxID=150966 RepID=A0AAD3SD88_NEPGR|nr:hypothetical protein Nepgr_010918 [Nepenthes gracilis]